jgi:hypothetical protein
MYRVSAGLVAGLLPSYDGLCVKKSDIASPDIFSNETLRRIFIVAG